MANTANSLARIFRYVEVMPLPTIVSLYFPNENLLLIDRELFNKLPEYERHKVLRTDEQVLEIRYPPNKPPRCVPRS